MPIQNYSELSSLKGELELKKHLSEVSQIKYWASVHLVFCKIKEDDYPYLAMIRRVKNEKDPWSGHYAFPGGGVEPGEGLKEASYRETYEEVGLEIPADSYLGEFYQIQVRMGGKSSPLAISAHASFISEGDSGKEQLPDLTPCPIEVDDAFWFPLKGLLREESIMEREFRLSHQNKTLPCINYEGHIIWGLSYMILREFLLQWEKASGPISQPLIQEHLPHYPYGLNSKKDKA